MSPTCPAPRVVPEHRPRGESRVLDQGVERVEGDLRQPGFGRGEERLDQGELGLSGQRQHRPGGLGATRVVARGVDLDDPRDQAHGARFDLPVGIGGAGVGVSGGEPRQQQPVGNRSAELGRGLEGAHGGFGLPGVQQDPAGETPTDRLRSGELGGEVGGVEPGFRISGAVMSHAEQETGESVLRIGAHDPGEALRCRLPQPRLQVEDGEADAGVPVVGGEGERPFVEPAGLGAIQVLVGALRGGERLLRCSRLGRYRERRRLFSRDLERGPVGEDRLSLDDDLDLDRRRLIALGSQIRGESDLRRLGRREIAHLGVLA